ncbi:MAG TPA: DUF4419 domain-containing protein [Kofleriaceae bacterium]|nr:DUF4419 domain-containing protein [Kofleriaceae bacterium]
MIRFPVSPVTPAAEPLPSTDVHERLRGHGLLAVEACARPAPPLAATRHGHGLLMAVHHAFAEHRPLALAPDHVWLCIAHGIARWVDGNAELLRPRLVRHRGRLPLEVRRDDFVAGGDNDWPGAVAEICALMHGHLGGRADLLVADFSTTDAEARTASHVALMSGMQKFFAYTVGTLCGIPEVTLEGTPADWQAIRARVDVLGELDLGFWAAPLAGVIDKLIDTARGDVDTGWWRDLYKLETASGGEVVTGWINVLFPFTGDDGVERNERAFDPGFDDPFSPRLRDFPSGLCQAPFTWNYHGDRRAMSLAGGFVGVAQLADGSLRPQPGWAIIPEPAARRFMVWGDPQGVPTLAPRDPKGLTSLEGIEQEVAGLERYALGLSFCSELRSLAGIERLTGLADVSLTDNPHVESLAALAGLPHLRKVFVTQCANLRDIRALRTLPALEELCLQRCPIDDIATIAGLDRLTSLSLFLDVLPRELCQFSWGADKVRPALAALAAFAARK